MTCSKWPRVGFKPGPLWKGLSLGTWAPAIQGELLGRPPTKFYVHMAYEPRCKYAGAVLLWITVMNHWAEKSTGSLWEVLARVKKSRYAKEWNEEVLVLHIGEYRPTSSSGPGGLVASLSDCVYWFVCTGTNITSGKRKNLWTLSWPFYFMLFNLCSVWGNIIRCLA